MKSTCLVVGLALLAASAGAPAARAQEKHIYWCEKGTGSAGALRAANHDGTAAHTIVAGYTWYVALDPPRETIYWEDDDGEEERLWSAGLAGGAPTLLRTQTSAFRPVVDYADARLYFTDYWNGLILRTELDGTAEQVVLSEAGVYVVALDSVGGKIYYGVSPSVATVIKRADLDGSNVETLVPAMNGVSVDLAVDPDGGKLYWAENDQGLIMRADLNGANVETLVVGAERIGGLALDPPGGKMYWTTDTWVRRANLNGSGIEDLVPVTYQSAHGIAVETCEVVVGVDSDCNANNVADRCEDCNGNGLADECDIAAATSDDDNANGVPDECENSPVADPVIDFFGTQRPCLTDTDCYDGTAAYPSVTCVPLIPGAGNPGMCYVARNRYLSVLPNPNATGQQTARRVSLSNGDGSSVVLGWIGEPVPKAVGAGEPSPQLLAHIEPNPHYRDWAVDNQGVPWAYPTLHVGDCQITPAHTYLIQSIPAGQDILNEANYSAPLVLNTIWRWGDVTGYASGIPDDNVSFVDISAVVAGFQGNQYVPAVWLDLAGGSARPDVPDFSNLSFADINSTVSGFQGATYPYAAPLDCPD